MRLKYFALLLSFTLCISVTACGGGEKESTEPAVSQAETTATPENTTTIPENTPDAPPDENPISSEDAASDFLLDTLTANGYNLEGTAVIPENEAGEFPEQSAEKWFFAWGKNDAEKFTAEKHFAVTSSRQVWEYDFISDSWNIFN